MVCALRGPTYSVSAREKVRSSVWAKVDAEEHRPASPLAAPPAADDPEVYGREPPDPRGLLSDTSPLHCQPLVKEAARVDSSRQPQLRNELRVGENRGSFEAISIIGSSVTRGADRAPES